MTRKTYMWEVMDTAPKNEVVLTDRGTGIWRSTSWYLCDNYGNIPCCSDYGHEISEIDPTYWMPIPTSDAVLEVTP